MSGFINNLEMSSAFLTSEVSSLNTETPISLFSNQCDTCGKTFAHSSSYRRHARTQCVSRTRKRRRKLWLPDDAEDTDAGITPLFATPESEPEGNIVFASFFYFYFVTRDLNRDDFLKRKLWLELCTSPTFLPLCAQAQPPD